VESFEELSDYLPDKLQPVLDYMEDNYIGRINRRVVRRTATFNIGLWNIYDRVVTDRARTTNAVEVWHRGIQSVLSEIHPTIWKFINGLRRYQKLKDTKIEGLIAGRNAARRCPAYECLNRCIKNIVLDYQNRDIIDYLRGLAHNIMH